MRRVVLVGGVRTPFCRAGTVLGSYSTLDLSVAVIESLVRRLNLPSRVIDEVVWSSVLLDPRYPNAARELVLRSILPNNISAHFISNNCISGLVAVAFVRDAILSGRISCGLAGGAESMSQPTLNLSRDAERFFIGLSNARRTGARLRQLTRFRPSFLLPLPPSPKEPSTGLTMGQHCEITAQEFSISRESQDAWALRSHKNASHAVEQGFMSEEIEPLGDARKDNFIRPDTTLEQLSKLRPVFDKSEKGTLTAGNSSGLTDGASVVCLMSEEVARAENLEILAFVEDIEFAAIDPKYGLLMAPALSLPRLLKRNQLRVEEIDIFEIHEAFAAQVIANRFAWEHGWSAAPEIEAIGKIPDEKINKCGGSLAIGHPFAATGGRLLLSAARQLQRGDQRTAVISVCAAGAMGAAVLLRKPE